MRLNVHTDRGDRSATISACGRYRYALEHLYAWRATDPRELRAKLVVPRTDFGFLELLRAARVEAEGSLNRAAIERAASLANVVVCAWGAQVWAREQASRVLGWLRASGRPLVCLGMTRAGDPRHPLFVPYSQPLIPFVPRGGS